MYRLLIPLALVVSTCWSPALAGRTTSITVPGGTQIRMYVVGNVSSQNARAGDSFEGQAASDVVVDGLVVVRKGAEGQGVLVDSKRMEESGGSNALSMVFDWVYAVDGTKVALSATDQSPAAATRRAQVPARVAEFGLAGYFGFVSAFVKSNVNVQTSTQGGQ